MSSLKSKEHVCDGDADDDDQDLTLSSSDWNWTSVYPGWWWTCRHHKHYSDDNPLDCFYCWRGKGRPDQPTAKDLVAFEFARNRMIRSARTTTTATTKNGKESRVRPRKSSLSFYLL